MKADLIERLHHPRKGWAGGLRSGLNAAWARSATSLPSVVMLLVVVACNAFLQPDFFSADSLSSNLQNAAPVVLVCMAQAVVVLVGELDLSVGAAFRSSIACWPPFLRWRGGARVSRVWRHLSRHWLLACVTACWSATSNKAR
jgi:ribose/xylose/arabinose/galactoside ABC-type transport system permease subunit